MLEIKSLRRTLSAIGLLPPVLFAGMVQAQSGTTPSSPTPPSGTSTAPAHSTYSRSTSGTSSTSPTGSNSSQPPTPSQSTTGRYGHGAQTSTGQLPHSSGDGPKIAEAAGAVAAAVIITELFMHHDSPKKIADHGPEVPKELDMSGFAIKALARPGWPVVLDYVLDGPGMVQVSITGDRHSQYSCNMAGKPTRRGFSIFNLPPNFGESSTAQVSSLPGGACPSRIMPTVPPDSKNDKLQIAVYKFTAVPMPGSNAPAPLLRVFGLGAGEKAVGSVAIDQLTFQPPAIHPASQEVAQFGFHAHSDFDGVRAEFVFTTLNNGHILLQQDQEQKLSPIPEGERGRGTWDGHGKPGEHMLQVRAWRGFQNGGDWVVAWSPDIVDVVR